MNILLGHPDQARREQGQRELDEIFERSPPISDIDALVSLNNAALDRIDDDPRIQKIWERAVGVREWDENLYRTWFKTKFLEGRWTNAQKVCRYPAFRQMKKEIHSDVITAGSDDVHEEVPPDPRTVLLEYNHLRACRETKIRN